MKKDKQFNHKNNNQENLMTVKEVAEYLQLSQTTIYRYCYSGKIPVYKIHSEWRFNKEKLDKWLEERTKSYYKESKDLKNM